MEDKEISYLKARRRYARIHLGVMLSLFSLAVLGAFVIPLEPGWRIGYALAATVTLLVGIVLSRRWAFQQMRALGRRMQEAREEPEGS